MGSRNESPYDLGKEGVLSSDLLSHCVTWEVSKAELAETESENLE